MQCYLNLRKKVIEHLTAINIIEQEETEEYSKSDLPEMGNGKPINSESIWEAAAKIDEVIVSKIHGFYIFLRIFPGHLFKYSSEIGWCRKPQLVRYVLNGHPRLQKLYRPPN